MEPLRRTLIAIASFSPLLGIPFLLVVLLFGVLLAIVTCLFIYEFLVGIGNHINNKFGGIVFALCILGWVLMPLHFINIIGATQ